jgi:hypothetical protein
MKQNKSLWLSVWSVAIRLKYRESLPCSRHDESFPPADDVYEGQRKDCRKSGTWPTLEVLVPIGEITC